MFLCLAVVYQDGPKLPTKVSARAIRYKAGIETVTSWVVIKLSPGLNIGSNLFHRYTSSVEEEEMALN